jgi:transposase
VKKVKEILRLKHEFGFSDRKIASSLNISRSTVKEYQDKFNEAGLSWKNFDEGNIEDFQRKLPATKSPNQNNNKRPLPNWDNVYEELKSKGVTLQLLLFFACPLI